MERKALGLLAKFRRKENVLVTKAKFSRKPYKGKKQKKDLSNVEYYGCYKKGHYQNKCPRKEQVVIIGDANPIYDEQEQEPSARGTTEYNIISQTVCYDDSCQTHLSKKDGLGQYLKKPTHQVSIVNSKEYISEDQVDDTRWELSIGSESGELIEEEDSLDSEVLEKTEALRLDTQRTQAELLESYQQRLEYAEQYITDLSDKLDKAEKYA